MDDSPLGAYDADSHVAEIYDRSETRLDDVDFLRWLAKDVGPLKVLEPFCGTGRILIPLALDGCTLVGMDRSAGMLRRAQAKIQRLPPEVQERILLLRADVLQAEWPPAFDLVILGYNCFYELAAPQEQETCIQKAFQCLNPGGYLFIDNDHMEGELAAGWRQVGLVEPSLGGRCSDGTVVESTRETVWFDAPQRLARFRRRTRVTLPDGRIVEQEYIQQKHPVSKDEIQAWLARRGFVIAGLYGNYAGEPYSEASPRAIFWARRKE